MAEKIPLIKNHHAHTALFAVLEKGLDINGVLDKDEALDRIRQLKNDFNLVLGWNNSRYTFKPWELDEFGPLLICNVSFHKFLLNRTAKEAYARDYQVVTENIDDPGWVEGHLREILEFITDTAALSAGDIKAYYDEMTRLGTWYAEDNLLPGERVADLFRTAGCLDRTQLWADPATYGMLTPGNRSIVTGVKLFLDGAVGAGTAALGQPYLTGGAGLMLYSDDALMTQIMQAASWGCALSVHAIGDRATTQLIRTLSQLKKNGRPMPSLVRLEHCQFLSLDMAKKAKALGIILSMQPNFSEDSIQYRDRLPTVYQRMNNPFRMLIDDVGFQPGVDLLFGTDNPYFDAAYALEAALFPPLESQELTLAEIVAGFCVAGMEKGAVEIDVHWGQRRVNTLVTLENYA